MKEINEIKLVIPTQEYKEQVMECRRIFLENNETFAGCSGLEEVNSYEEWIDFENRLSNKYGKNYVPSTVFLAVRIKDNKLVGIIDFRHKLTDFLYNYGGNIGYSIVLSERRKGYGKEMLRLMLEHCKNMGVHRVLITCDKENIGSSKTIISNGGILENEVKDDVGLVENGIIQRYWIPLSKRYATAEQRKEIKEKEFKTLEINDEIFNGRVCLVNIKKAEELVYRGEEYEVTLVKDNYKWLEFYDYNSKICLTAFYDENNKIIEWYFDIARRIGNDNGVPYEEDLYLDIVALPNGKICLLDEEELKNARKRGEVTEEEYKEAYQLAYDLMEKIKGKTNELTNFTDRILKKLL